MAKKKQNNHLTINDDGSLTWDWDALLKEVQDAMNIVTITEAKVKRTRKSKEV